MPKVTINGTEYEVEAGKTVLQAALERGIYIPHYCYHPYLPISGACRMCLVDIKPGPPKLSIACNTVVADGMEVVTENEKVAAARRAVMEFLLKNHPIDCPICDQAGECWLQDYYMDYGLEPARVRVEDKIAKRKKIRAGETMMLDADRCILCGRCVRFMKEVVGDDCLTIMNRRDVSEITLFPGREMDNPYSMNLAGVCPVGAWTTVDFRFKKRTWFLSESPSVCPTCSKGCNTWIDHHRGEVFRIRPRINDEINKCWLCDRGRLAYHAINDERLLAPAVGGGEAGWDEALSEAAGIVNGADGKLVAVAYGSLSVEEGEAAVSLFKDELKGKVVLFAGAPGGEDDFLMKSDQNANVKGLTDAGIGEALAAELPDDSVLVVIETAGGQKLPDGLPAPALVITPTTSLSAGSAKVALPSATYAESAGTFVNADGVSQAHEPAIAPMGGSRSVTDILTGLALALGRLAA